MPPVGSVNLWRLDELPEGKSHRKFDEVNGQRSETEFFKRFKAGILSMVSAGLCLTF
jgi:hypothetical protein